MTPKINLSLCKYNKNSIHLIAFQEKIQKIKEKYPNYTHVFMNGSKQNNVSIEKFKLKNISQEKP